MGIQRGPLPRQRSMPLPRRCAGYPVDKLAGAERRPRSRLRGTARADTIMGRAGLTPERTVSPAETITRGLPRRAQ